MKRPVRIGIVGCGAIGSELAEVIDRRFRHRCKLVALNDLTSAKAAKLSRKLKSKPKVTSLDLLIGGADLVVESASAKAVAHVAEKVLRRGKSLLAMSVGGLLLNPHLIEGFNKKPGTLYLPSGAVAGIDGIAAAKVAGLRKAVLTTRKPPAAFQGAPYLLKKKINLSKLKRDTLLFKGPAADAVKYFPQNINVAAILSLAGIGPRKTEVRIYACPGLKRNIHTIEIEGGFGRMTCTTENVPSPSNPKTSYLASVSPAALIDKIVSSVKIGT